MNEFDLRINEYANVPSKDLRKEIIRLEDLLAIYRKDEENKKEEISQVLNNIEICKKKLGYNGKEKTRIIFDRTFRWILWAVLVIYCFTLLVLPIWMILTSFKDPLEFTSNQFGFPSSFNFDNFVSVFKKLEIRILGKGTYNMFGMAGISLAYSFGSTLWGVLWTTLMAYVLCKYKFIGSRVIYTVGIIIMIVPIIGSGPSAMMIRRNLGIYDNLFLSIITGPSTCFSGLNFLLLYGAFKSLPWDYAEAVFVDGGGHWSAFLKMYLPMVHFI